MFENARLKVQRANQHIADFENTFQIFRATGGYSIHVHGHPQGSFHIEARLNKPLDPIFALIIGDAIHNLRTALDHAHWELVGLDGGTQNRNTKLPTGDTRQSFEAAAKGVITPRQDTKDFLVGLGVYPDGPGSLLYRINLLDNADKHTVLTPVIGVSSIEKLTIYQRGTDIVVMEMRDCSFAPGPDGVVRIASIGPGHSIKADDHIKATLSPFFGKVDFAPDEPVQLLLAQMAQAVSDTILRFENFAINRK